MVLDRDAFSQFDDVVEFHLVGVGTSLLGTTPTTVSQSASQPTAATAIAATTTATATAAISQHRSVLDYSIHLNR